MRLSKILRVAMFAVALVVPVAQASADDRPLDGCWSAEGNPSAMACFGGQEQGLFLLFWDGGHCSGSAYYVAYRAGKHYWEVPRQKDSCFQYDKVERLALREYACRRNETGLQCRETIYLDDGSVWKTKQNVVFVDK